jgi:hypothetical protein
MGINWSSPSNLKPDIIQRCLRRASHAQLLTCSKYNINTLEIVSIKQYNQTPIE